MTTCVEGAGRRTFPKHTELLSAVMQNKQGNSCLFPNVSAVALLIMYIVFDVLGSVHICTVC